MHLGRLQSLRIQVPLRIKWPLFTDDGPDFTSWKLLARHPTLQNLDISFFLFIDQPMPTYLLSLSQLTTLRITSSKPKVTPKHASLTLF